MTNRYNYKPYNATYRSDVVTTIKPYSNADRLQAKYDEIHGDKRPYLERNGPRLAFLCIVGLAAIAAVSWGWPLFVDWLIGNVGVDV